MDTGAERTSPTGDAMSAYSMRMESAHAVGRQRLNLTLPGSLIEEVKALGRRKSTRSPAGITPVTVALDEGFEVFSLPERLIRT